MKIEVPWSIGFIVGAVLTSFGCAAIGIGGLVRTLLVIGGGVLGGIAGEAIARSSRAQ